MTHNVRLTTNCPLRNFDGGKVAMLALALFAASFGFGSANCTTTQLVSSDVPQLIARPQLTGSSWSAVVDFTGPDVRWSSFSAKDKAGAAALQIKVDNQEPILFSLGFNKSYSPVFVEVPMLSRGAHEIELTLLLGDEPVSRYHWCPVVRAGRGKLD